MSYSELNLQRKKEIEECLLTLMQGIPFEEITVKDLAEKLHIARKTFYHYYPNKWECLQSLTERILYECTMRVMQEIPREDLAGAYRCRMQYWIEHKDYLDVINRNKLGLFFMNCIMEYVGREESAGYVRLSAPDMQLDEDILFFYISGQVFLLLKWAEKGFPLPMDEMVKKYLRLAREPLVREDS